MENHNDDKKIDVLEDNIINFNNQDMNEIMETIKNKFTNIDYFFRTKDNELHIVKYNEKLKLNVNEFVNSLLKYYSLNNKNIIEGVRVKGNQNFVIIENLKQHEKIILDLSKLLSMKK